MTEDQAERERSIDPVLARALKGEVSPEEEAAVRNWRRASPEHEAEYRELSRIVELSARLGELVAAPLPSPPSIPELIARSGREPLSGSWADHTRQEVPFPSRSMVCTVSSRSASGNTAMRLGVDHELPDRLKQSFKDFADRKIDWEIVAAKPPIPTKEAQIDERGALVLRGYFDAGSSHIVYELDFVQSAGEWKPIKLNVNVKPSADK